MDKTILINIFKVAEILLNELKDGNIKIDDALWIFDEERKNWNLILSSPIVKNEGTL